MSTDPHAPSRFRTASLCLVGALVLWALPGVMPLDAQTPETGRITGQVIDLESGQPLPGAQILVDGSGSGILAGVSGRFQLDAVPAGTRVLRVQYLGYRPAQLESVEVRAGETTRIEIRLERAAIEVEGISVVAQREGGTVATALNAQRTASGVMNSISAEQIARSPDGDAAAAVKRVSGVTVQDGKYVFVRGLGERYTTASLNGARIPSPEPERKVVPLDLFPSGLLEAVSTQKTFTPDQPGDFSGGVVNIRTPEFPLRPVYSFSMSTGYRPGITGSPIPSGPSAGSEWLGLGTGPRTLPDPARNYSGAASRGDEVNQVVNSFRNSWSVLDQPGRLPASLGGSVGGSTDLGGRTLGYLGSLTYSNSQEARLDQRRARVGTGQAEIDRYDGQSGSTSVLWGGLANVGLLLGNHSEIHLNNSYNRSADNEARIEIGVDENTRSTVQVERLRYVERSVRSTQLRGEHQLAAAHGMDWSVSHSAVSRAEPDRSEFVTWMDPETPVWFNDFEGAVRTFGGLDESSAEVGANYTFTLARSGGAPHRIRVGGLVRSTDRTASSQGFRIQAFNWTPTDPRWQMRPEEFFDGRFAANGDSEFLLSRELSGGNYTASDRQGAAYAMTEIELHPRLQVITGARLERSEIQVDAENQLGQADRTDREYTDLLPSLGLNIELTGTQQLRLAGSRTLARPEYREMAPITYREVLGGEQVIGNQELEHTLIDNFDARWEWYPSGDELLSLGVFAKRFHNPIEQRYLARSGTNTRTFENADSAVNYGIEAEVMKGLGGLDPRLDPLGLFMNVTVMRSRVNTGNEGDVERAMVGQAPYVLNGGLTWAPVASGLTATLLYNVVGERIVNARASGTQVDDVVERPRNVVDLSVRFPLLAGASGKVDLSNLLDAPYEVAQGSVVREFHRTGRGVSVGVSWQFR
ncbi:MAG: TonB-dependent receptor [Gemmatimonadales bacterium]|nr:MAG: TonB-dependent receptor [Gemmatimonadales bacterium]